MQELSPTLITAMALFCGTSAAAGNSHAHESDVAGTMAFYLLPFAAWPAGQSGFGL